MDKKQNHVRLTEEAHWLLAEMAEDCNATMRELASEAITRMAERRHNDTQFAYGAFALGAIAGGVLMCVVFFVRLVI